METIPFAPSYSAGNWPLRFSPSGKDIEIVLTRTNKTEDYPWGVPFGKEDLIDDKDPLSTAIRESEEECGLLFVKESLNLFYSESHRDTSGNFDPVFKKTHGKHCYYSWEDESSSQRLVAQHKDSIVEVGWYTLKQAEMKKLKITHRRALIELCYVLEEPAITDKRIANALQDLIYSICERPSTIDGNFIQVKDGKIMDLKNKVPETLHQSYLGKHYKMH